MALRGPITGTVGRSNFNEMAGDLFTTAPTATHFGDTRTIFNGHVALTLY